MIRLRSLALALLPAVGCSSAGSSTGHEDLAPTATCVLSQPETPGYQLSYDVDLGGPAHTRVETLAQIGTFHGRRATEWSVVSQTPSGSDESTEYRAFDAARCAGFRYEASDDTWYEIAPGQAVAGSMGSVPLYGGDWTFAWSDAPSATVPAGTYHGCLKLDLAAAGARKLAQTYCPGVGMIEEIDDSPALGGLVMTTRLSSVGP